MSGTIENKGNIDLTMSNFKKLFRIELTDKQEELSNRVNELLSLDKDFLKNILEENNDYNIICDNGSVFTIFHIENKLRRIWSKTTAINQRDNYKDKKYCDLEILFNKLENNIRDFSIWVLENNLHYYFGYDNSINPEYLVKLIKLYYISCCAKIISTEIKKD